jgi:HD-like signal output (HDOD) protein
MNDVVACLELDPGLAARILRVVNSSRYGLGRPIVNIRHAATYLGQKSLRLFAVTFSLVEALGKGIDKKLSADHWPRALAIATIAARLARNSDDLEDNDAYTAGLLADVGVLVFAQQREGNYATLYARAGHGPQLVQAEEDGFGFGHAVLGARLLAKWDLPESIVVAVASHHSEGELTPLAQCVRAASLMAEALLHPAPEKLEHVRRVFESQYAIGVEELVEFAQGCRADLKESAALFGEAAFRPTWFDAFAKSLQTEQPVAAEVG